MAVLRFVAKTDTFERQRQVINTIGQDIFDLSVATGEGAFSLSDGTVDQPSLFFTNAADVGIYRTGVGKQLFIGAEGNSIASFEKDSLTLLQKIQNLSTPINTVTIGSGGSGYNVGAYPKARITGGNGAGAQASVIVSMEGTFQSGGGYEGGTYTQVPLQGGNGSGAEATLEIATMGGNITAAGSNGTANTYNNVSLTNVSSSGSGAVAAEITVAQIGPDVGVIGVFFEQGFNTGAFGNGYKTGDVLSVNPADIGGVTGFEFTLTGGGEVTSVEITDGGDGNYQAGDTLFILPSDVQSNGGPPVNSPSGFSFNVTGVGIITDVTITDGGDNYKVGDSIDVPSSELVNTVTYLVKILDSQLVEFTGTLPSTGFNVGDTLTYNGVSKEIVKRFLNGSNQVEAVTVKDINLNFSAGLQADDGNGNQAEVSELTAALNYYFSFDGGTTYTNIPDFTFQKNVRYNFDQTDASNIGHPLRFSENRDGFHGKVQLNPTIYGETYNGIEVDYSYLTNVVSIVPKSTTPTTLYYFCGEGTSEGAAHKDEGGFDNREGTITVSGEAALVGSGLSITVSDVTQTSTFSVLKDGTTTLGNTTATRFVNTGTTDLQGNITAGGTFNLGPDLFTIAANGDTVIEGTLTANSDLFFTSDATFGGVLYVDATNNKISINRDPSVTPLVEDFEVDGSVSIDGNVKLASDSGAYVSIGGAIGTQALDVSGSAIVSGKYIAPTTGVVSSPVYTFEGYERIGLSANSTNKSISVTGQSGELVRFEPIQSSSFRDFVTYKREITATTISSPGAEYTPGSYSGVASSGGTGDGLDADITIAFSVPIGKIATLGTITTSVDPLRLVGTYNKVTYTTNGSGIDAKFNVVIDGTGAVSSVSVVTGELTNFTSSVNTIAADSLTSYSGVSGTSSGSGSGATFNVSRNISGAATVTLVNSGQNYVVNETITILGSSIGGIDVTNDLTITITAVSSGGGLGYAINDVITVSGTVFGDGTTTPADVTFQVSNLVGILGAGYTDNEYVNVPLSTDGSGVGATANITITGGAVSAIAISSEGSGGYVPGDEITFDHNNLIDPTTGTVSSAPSLAAQFFVGSLGTIQVVDIVDNGFGYVNGDVLTFPLLPGTPTSTFELTIGTVTETEVIKLETNTGLITSESLKTKSININDKISIVDSTISNQASEDVTISPGGPTKLLRVTGTGGVKVPVGTSTNRPSASTLGIIRYNSSTQQYEGSNGSDFISLGGVRDVDGNTYILAEKTVGANDNILYFYNDAVNTSRFNKTDIELVTNNTIKSVATDGKTLWKDGISVVLNEQVYAGEYIYEVTVAGTTGSNPPTHTTGALDDGNGVEFTFVGSVYQPLTFKASNITFDATLTLGALESYSYNSVSSVLETGLNNIEFAFGKVGGAPNTSFTLSDDGSLKANRSFDTSNAVSNLKILDYTAKFLELDDVVISTSDLTLTRGATESANFVVYDPTVSKSAKVTVTAENTTTNDIHTTEIQLLAKGSDIFISEYASLNTGQEQFTYTVSFDPSGEVQISYTMDQTLTVGDVVVITSSSTSIKK
tara:strand:- start:18635 stop:23302 length:4668 start_codon:yes stop_codon:yes gene_type:complete